jgi:hypothetical protein
MNQSMGMCMSTSQIIPHIKAGYIERIIDGYEDWLTTFQGIEGLMAIAEELRFRHLLMDFTAAELQISSSEAPDIARLVDGLAPWSLEIGIVTTASERSHNTLAAIASGITAFDHRALILTNQAAKTDWILGIKSVSRAS